ncbi:uncharacterized protein LOC129741900 [Uranotaenia lowii]|uniref:uncharacterized protein LOC129741900 n=1 Tax=Uranotaenia lowii TaxID=190385 RepID=UPI00247AE2B6|nr:uncharacterized protein LOC129741900 [Uranotaenia lowii]
MRTSSALNTSATSPENHKQNQQPSSNTANKPNHQSTLAKQQQPNHPPSTDIQQQQHNDPVSSDQHQQPYQPNPSIHQKHNDPVSSDQHQQSYQPNPSIHQQHSHQLTPVSQERQNQQTPSINQQQSSINIEPASVNTTSTITQPTQSGTSIDFSYRTLSYIPSLTAKIIRDLKKEFLNVKFAQKTINNVGKLFPIVKDPILPAQQSKIIYSIPCRDCEKVYIGMSTNTLTKRMYGHKSDVNRYEKVLTTGVTNTAEIKKKLGDTTAMTDHVINTQHRFDHNRAKIIDRAQYTSTLRVLEMCHITNTTNTVNYRTDTASLSATYTGILQSVKPKQPSINSNSINNNQNSHITTIPIPLTNSESSTSNNTHTFHITQYP